MGRAVETDRYERIAGRPKKHHKDCGKTRWHSRLSDSPPSRCPQWWDAQVQPMDRHAEQRTWINDRQEIPLYYFASDPDYSGISFFSSGHFGVEKRGGAHTSVIASETMVELKS